MIEEWMEMRSVMKVVGVNDATLEQCVRLAGRDRVIITRNGVPIAVLVRVKGLDMEQLELGYSDRFWTLIRHRRGQGLIKRRELEKRLGTKKQSLP